MTDDSDIHERQAKAIAHAVFQLFPTFTPHGFSPEAIVEGVINGAAAALMGGGMNRFQVADLLSHAAEVYRAPEPKRGKLHVVE